MSAALVAVVLATATHAAERDVPGQRGGTYIEPPATVDPLYLPAGPNRPAEAAASSILALRLSLDLPLDRGSAAAGSGAQGSRPGSPTVQAALRFTPLADSAWFVQANFFRYLHADRQQPWNPDFTYAFGYDDWRPGTFSLTYANYSGTRFDPDRTRGEGRSNFRNGQWSVGYKFELPAPMAEVFLVGDGDQAGCNTGANFTPRYMDLGSLSMKRNKTSLAFGCRYMRPGGWFVQMTAFAWPDRDQQQPWDPDFTYAFGLFDWRPGTWSVQYSNYSGNRFSAGDRARGQGRLRHGSLTLSWTTAF